MGAWLVVALLSLVPGRLAAQDVQVLNSTFARNFERAEDPDTRIAVVRDAVASKVPGMGPFYVKVIEFAVSRAPEIPTDSRLIEMVLLASTRIAEEKYVEGRTAAWNLFKAADEVGTRLAALKALAATAAGDSRLVGAMASFLRTLNELQGTSSRPDPQVVLALVRTLGSIGDVASFSALFASRVAGYSGEITAAADAALLATRGDLRALFGQIIRTGSAVERRDAFALALSAPSIDQQSRAVLAEEALRGGLAMSAPGQESRLVARELRASALGVLEAARWSRATPLVVEHFSTATVEYDRGQVTIDYVAAAASGLGAMGTREASERLTVYLELLNSYRELGKPYDERIVLAVIVNLGRLGDKSSFATLSYAQYLDYSDRVKQAARDAIRSLKW